MGTLFLTLAVVASVMLAMSLGAILGGRRLRGSCGRTGEGCACSPAEREACAHPERTAP